MQSNQILDEITVWLRRKNGSFDFGYFDCDTDLIDEGILSSLDFVEFILFLEQRSGTHILDEDMEPAHFRTVRSIMRRFFCPPDRTL